MFDTIIEKIEYEYLKWSNFIYAGSVSDCMARSFEIAFKRAFYQKIKEKCNDLSADAKEVIMQRKNYIDYVYLKCKDNQCLNLKNEIISDEDFSMIIKLCII